MARMDSWMKAGWAALAAVVLMAGCETGSLDNEGTISLAELQGIAPHVTAVTEFAGRPVGGGRPGPVWRELNRVFEADLRNPAMLTPLW